MSAEYVPVTEYTMAMAMAMAMFDVMVNLPCSTLRLPVSGSGK